MSYALWDVWEEEPDSPITKYGRLRWRVQLLNGKLGYFPSREDAEGYVVAVKDYRHKQGLA